MKNNYIASGRARQKQKTRDRILSSAQQFLRRGEAFTLEDIAHDTSLSRASVYRYYSSVDILAREAGLDLQVQSPEALVASLQDRSPRDRVTGIQAYFNRLAITNEAAFRKYLSLVITEASGPGKRGARRTKALRLALEHDDGGLSAEEKEKLVVIATALMGIEALIVTKDVCHLDNERAAAVLEWGLEKLIDGLLAEKRSENPE